MIEQEKRVSDMISLINKLDISPTMYKDAVEKYKNIGTFLFEKGIKADFYPQGSFSLGTVIRPYKNNKDANFDLDSICQVDIYKRATTPQLIKEMVENAFKSDERYKSRLKVYDKCCTIEYVETNGIGFSIDIVPAVDEESTIKNLLKQKSSDPECLDTAIAITDKKSEEYEWATNNPKGFKTWFEQINRPFLENNPQQSRSAIFESNKGLFASIEDIPIELERSSLQRVIQILKRHRDVYFSKITNGNNLKPISAIITTIVTYIAETAPTNLGVFELLKYVLSEFDIYSERQILNEDQFSTKYQNKNIVKRVDGEWKIENPANPEDNLADAWNKNSSMPKAFFNWTRCVSNDFLKSIDKTDVEFFTNMESAFGSNFVRGNLDVNKYLSAAPIPKLINVNSQSKPWSR